MIRARYRIVLRRDSHVGQGDSSAMAAQQRLMAQASPTTRAQRYHHLDAGRALFMLLGIPFHASLAFAGGHWMVMSGARDPFLALLPPLLSDFRMPGFFVIAGFFAAMLLQRRSRTAWLKGRVERLGVPLLFGFATIVPLQAAIVKAAPEAIVDRAAAADPLSHLWFLPTLLLLCALLAAIWPVLTRFRSAYTPGVIVLGLSIAVYQLALLVGERLLHSELIFAGGLFNFDALVRFAPFFAIGVAIRLSSTVAERFGRLDPAVAIVGLVALALHVFLREDQSRLGLALDILFDGISSLCVVQIILTVLMRVARSGSRTTDRLVDASFTIYLLHHPVVVAMAILCIRAGLPPLVSWLAICVVAFVLPYAAHRLLRRSPLALWLMNGVRPNEGRRGLLVPRPVSDLRA